MHNDMSQFIFRPGAHELFELFATIMNVHSAFFTMDIKPIYSGARLSKCQYCRMVGEDLGRASKCHQQDIDATRTVSDTQDLYSYVCHAGMHEMALPIFCDEETIGYVIIGQFRDKKQRRSPFASEWKRRFGTNDLQIAYEETPAFTADQIEGIRKLFRHAIRYIESEYMVIRKDFDLIHPLIERMRNNPDQDLTMAEAKECIGRSTSAVNRLFKKLTGLPLRQYQIRLKLNKAKHVIQDHPLRPISQIAFDLGFTDPLYFSRIFKKHTGETPSNYRKRVSGNT